FPANSHGHNPIVSLRYSISQNSVKLAAHDVHRASLLQCPGREEMEIPLFRASGMIGPRGHAEAAARGIEVTAITRSGTEVPGAASSLAGDIADAEFDARMADAHDVIVSTTGPSRTGGDHRIWLDGLSTLAEASGTTRLFVVGGAG